MKQYNPKEVDVIIGAIKCEGFDDSQMVTVRNSSDLWTTAMGADGEMTRSKSADKSGEVELFFKQSSASIAKLTAQAVIDRETGNGVVPVLIRDRSSGASFHGAPQGFIKKIPDTSYGKESGSITFIVVCENLENFPAGNAVV